MLGPVYRPTFICIASLDGKPEIVREREKERDTQTHTHTHKFLLPSFSYQENFNQKVKKISLIHKTKQENIYYRQKNVVMTYLSYIWFTVLCWWTLFINQTFKLRRKYLITDFFYKKGVHRNHTVFSSRRILCEAWLGADVEKEGSLE